MYSELLKQMILDKTISNLFRDKDNWETLIINRRKPYTERMWAYTDDVRVCVHTFSPCTPEESFAHPHPWPGAFMILQGEYDMEVGYSKDRTSPPEHVMRMTLPEHSIYEIESPLVWHKVIPKRFVIL